MQWFTNTECVTAKCNCLTFVLEKNLHHHFLVTPMLSWLKLPTPKYDKATHAIFTLINVTRIPTSSLMINCLPK